MREGGTMMPEGVKEFYEWKGTDLRDCTLCGICSAVCPSFPLMSFGPMQIIELLRLGEKAQVLQSTDLWWCTDCYLCSQRCPVNIPVAEIFDRLRLESVSLSPKAGSRWVEYARNFASQLERYARIDPAEDLAWTYPKPPARGFFGAKSEKKKREPLPSIRDVPSFFEFWRRWKGLPEPEVKEVKKKK